jgi:hypothetical protein
MDRDGCQLMPAAPSLVMAEFVALFSRSIVIGVLVLATLVAVVGLVLWWNRKID